MKSVFHFIARHPWLYVVLAFILLIASWVVLILVAARHPNPEFKATMERKIETRDYTECTDHKRVVQCMAFTIRMSRRLDRLQSTFPSNPLQSEIRG
ncbi:MAG: hypothetical protein WCP35_11275 [Verrucomicrobiota bacterium]